MTPTEKRDLNKSLMTQIKKADLVTAVCLCCVIAAKAYKREPVIEPYFNTNNINLN